MKRIVLFVMTNLAVMLVLSIVLKVFGIDRYMAQDGINFGSLLAFSAVLGFGGAIVSLLISKQVAKWSTGAQVIDGSEGSTQAWLVQTVRRLAEQARIGMPTVAIFEGAPNAFATGAFKNSALVAVSTGLLQSMNREEVEAVLGHEVAHVANGDMITLTLLQGVLNTFVIFLSRVVGFVVDKFLNRSEDGEESSGMGPGYFLTSLVLQLVFGIFASMIVAWFSRRREFRADTGGAELVNPQAMASALNRLRMQQGEPSLLPSNMQAFGIRGGGMLALFASHPPLEQRIGRLVDGSWRS